MKNWNHGVDVVLVVSAAAVVTVTVTVVVVVVEKQMITKRHLEPWNKVAEVEKDEWRN